MHTRLIVEGSDPVPPVLRQIIESGSTTVEEIGTGPGEPTPGGDGRVVRWTGRELVLDDRHLRWPQDEDEIRLLFQSAG